MLVGAAGFRAQEGEGPVGLRGEVQLRGGLAPAWASLLGAQALLGPQSLLKKLSSSPPLLPTPGRPGLWAQIQGQISFLLQELSSFQGEGPFATFGAVTLRGAWRGPTRGPGIFGQSGGQWMQLSDPYVPSCVSGSGVWT